MSLAALHNVSASQITSWKRCQRYWLYRHVKKIPSPQTVAQARGTDIHAEIEHYLLTGEIRDSLWAAYVHAARPHLPKFDKSGDSYRVEHKFSLPTFDGGPPWIGYIDLRQTAPFARLGDYKTTSDFRYAKTPAELARDTQLLSYAKEFYTAEGAGVGPIEIGHLYLLTRNKTPKAMYVSTTVTISRVEDQWAEEMAIVRQMLAVDVEDASELPPTTESCGMYGGCQYRSLCGLSPVVAIRPQKPEITEENNMASEVNGHGMSFMERLKASIGGAPDQGAPRGIVPPDAASRTTVDIREATPPKGAPKTAAAPAPGVTTEAAVAPKKRGRPPKAAGSTTAPVPCPRQCGTFLVGPLGDSGSYQHPQSGKCVSDGMTLAKSIALAAPPPPLESAVPLTDALAAKADALVKLGLSPAAAMAAARGVVEDEARIAAAKAKADEETALAAAITKADEEAAAAKIKADAARASFVPTPTPTPAPATVTTSTTTTAAITAAAKAPRQGLRLYIDCYPVKTPKGSDDVTEFTDWVAPMCERVATENEVSHWALVKFAQVAEGLLASQIRARIADVPPVLIINSASRAAQVGIEVLSPYASDIVRPLR